MASTLPDVLLSPPWLVEPSTSRSLHLAPPTPRLAVPDDVRETWLTRFDPPRRPPSPDLDDEVLDRYLDALDRRQKPREAEAAWLTDAGLLELLREAGRNLSLRVAEYALARLREDAIPPIAKASLGFPDSELRPLFEWLFAPGLARQMATDLRLEPVPDLPPAAMRAQPYVPSATWRWMTRFAAETVAELLPMALAESEDEQLAAKNALSRLALSGIPVAETADAAGLSFEMQPRWMQYEPMPEVCEWALVWMARPRRSAVDLLDGAMTPALVRNLARWCDAEWPPKKGSQAPWSLFHHWREEHTGIVEQALADPSYHPLESRRPPSEWLHVPHPRHAKPDFWDLASFPRPRLSDGSPLPDEAMEHFATMMQFAREGQWYRGLLETIDACDASSLDEFGAAVLSALAKSEMAFRDDWVVPVALLFGGEQTFAQMRVVLDIAEEKAGRLFQPDDSDALLVRWESARCRKWADALREAESSRG